MRYIKPFNEAVGDTFAQDLKDFCEMNLAYLLDEELDISIRGGLGLSFKLTLELNENPRLWNDIKDHMIPFLTRLSNQYELRSFPINNRKNVTIEVTRDLEAARQNWPHRKTSVFYEVPRLINDDTKSGLYYAKLSSNPDVEDDSDDVLKSYITEFEFIIDGYKQPKKSAVLTKIKSFYQPFKKYEPSNESLDTIKRKIEELGEAHLVYLFDEGYEVTYKPTDSIIQQRDLVIEIKLGSEPTSEVSYNYKHFTWNNVKDRVIPLVTQLNKEYNIEVDISDGNFKHFPVDLVISDAPARWFAPNSIRWIRIIIKRYLFKKDAKF